MGGDMQEGPKFFDVPRGFERTLAFVAASLRKAAALRIDYVYIV